VGRPVTLSYVRLTFPEGTQLPPEAMFTTRGDGTYNLPGGVRRYAYPNMPPKPGKVFAPIPGGASASLQASGVENIPAVAPSNTGVTMVATTQALAMNGLPIGGAIFAMGGMQAGANGMTAVDPVLFQQQVMAMAMNMNATGMSSIPVAMPVQEQGAYQAQPTMAQPSSQPQPAGNSDSGYSVPLSSPDDDPQPLPEQWK
jgi:hypothetical protein